MTKSTGQETRKFDYFEHLFHEYQEATPLTKKEKFNRLVSQLGVLALSEGGIRFLYGKVSEVEASGFFDGTVWADPEGLQPSFVKGTMKLGHPDASIELMSELRMLALANEDMHHPKVTAEEAKAFLGQVLVHNLEFVYTAYSEETRATMSEQELHKASNLFGFLIETVPLDHIKTKLFEEIKLLLEQRPVVMRPVRDMIHTLHDKLELDATKPEDHSLLEFVDALYQPSPGTKGKPDLATYRAYLEDASANVLEQEARQMGEHMRRHGLVSDYHALLLKTLVAKGHDALVPVCLKLTLSGEGTWEARQKFVSRLIEKVIHPSYPDPVYGLAMMLDLGLFAQSAIRAGLDNLMSLKLNPKVEQRILKSIANPDPDIPAIAYLVGALLKVLGQPLGIGQGNNPTCQSARGISMWSQHSPAKLINMVITAATQNNLIMRFESHNLESSLLGKGLMNKLDYNLDAVSIVLVPHLDKLYNEMMRLASGRFEDPHKWVNPAMYGHWIQIGFASSFDYLTQSIRDFDGFMRRFYAGFHPAYNGGQRIVYPNPVGIFITDAKGRMLGFHAVSLLRVKEVAEGGYRAYFLNPNNEGRQDWGQGITPTVFGHGERHGESSLPFDHFAARLYAFHYNALQVAPLVAHVPHEVIMPVRKLAEASWGQKYVWNEIEKIW